MISSPPQLINVVSHIRTLITLDFKCAREEQRGRFARLVWMSHIFRTQRPRFYGAVQISTDWVTSFVIISLFSVVDLLVKRRLAVLGSTTHTRVRSAASLKLS